MEHNCATLYEIKLVLCRPEQDEQPTLTFLQERLESKAAEISGLREEVRRLRESRLCLDALPSGRASAEDDTVCISAAELAAMKKDMEVRLPMSIFCLHLSTVPWRFPTFPEGHVHLIVNILPRLSCPLFRPNPIPASHTAAHQGPWGYTALQCSTGTAPQE